LRAELASYAENFLLERLVSDAEGGATNREERSSTRALARQRRANYVILRINS